jgi:hypothetical protein
LTNFAEAAYTVLKSELVYFLGQSRKIRAIRREKPFDKFSRREMGLKK